jgi:hypothetical protein
VDGSTGCRARRRATYGIALAAIAAAFGAAGVALAADHGLQAGAIPSVVKAVEDARRGKPMPARLIPPMATIKLFPRRYTVSRACLAHNNSKVVPSRVCRVGDTSSEKLIVLLGDSHAFMWLPAVLVTARRDGWTVVPLLRFGCTPEKWFTNRGPNGPICRAWLRWAIGEIRRLRPTVTLLGGSVGETPSPQTSAAAAGMVAAARTLEPFGRPVVIGDPEGLSANPRQCIAAPNASLMSCMTTWPSSSLAAYDAVARGTKSLGVGFLATRGFVCYERQCPAVVGHTIVWMDTNHLTGIYSAQLAAPFRAAFLREMS